MDALKKKLLSQTLPTSEAYIPEIYKLTNDAHRQQLENILSANPGIVVLDELDGQLRELVKSLNPSIKIKEEDYPGFVSRHLAGRDMHTYGVWIYYPWSNKLIHSLDEEEFVEIRTNRNRYKLTTEEQELLRGKKIGVIGLSVGQSIALTLAMERTCGELRLADFDTAELSNLNRIRTGIHNLGIKKTIIAAREIAEIDPFIKVKIFSDGIHNGNIDAFFEEGGKLDLLVEVCDGLDVKIVSRFKARSLQIPVVMDTNDRGMLDVERFDLEPERPILHGLAGDLDPEKIGDLTNEQKIPYILKMVGADTISTRLKASMMEVEQSVNTWPQLASSVVLGGALTTDVCRRILLDEYHDSGRYYIDLDELVKDKEPITKPTEEYRNPYAPLQIATMEAIAAQYFAKQQHAAFNPAADVLDKIIDAALLAPSAGNNQPWKWYYEQGTLFLFHDKYRSWSWGDYYEMGSHMGLGTALENVHLESAKLNLTDNQQLLPIADEPRLIATVTFTPAAEPADKQTLLLAGNLEKRYTNRKLGPRQPLPTDVYTEIAGLVDGIDGVTLRYAKTDDELEKLGRIIAACDRIRLLNEQGHKEFYEEVRWDSAHAAATLDGIELAAVDLSQSDIAGFKVARDWNAVKLVAGWNKGNALKRLSVKTLQSASAMALVSIEDFNHKMLVKGGRAVEKAWIYANSRNISIHPMLSPLFFFNRLVHGKGIELADNVKEELVTLRNEFLEIFPPIDKNGSAYTDVFLMKMAIADDIGIRSLRKPKQELFYKK